MSSGRVHRLAYSTMSLQFIDTMYNDLLEMLHFPFDSESQNNLAYFHPRSFDSSTDSIDPDIGLPTDFLNKEGQGRHFRKSLGGDKQ